MIRREVQHQAARARARQRTPIVWRC